MSAAPAVGSSISVKVKIACCQNFAQSSATVRAHVITLLVSALQVCLLVCTQQSFDAMCLGLGSLCLYTAISLVGPLLVYDTCLTVRFRLQCAELYGLNTTLNNLVHVHGKYAVHGVLSASFFNTHNDNQ